MTNAQYIQKAGLKWAKNCPQYPIKAMNTFGVG